MNTEIYVLIGQSTVYVINCVVSIYLLYRFNKNINEKLNKMQQRTEPVQEPEQPETARVDRGTAIQMNAYVDQQRGVYEITPKESDH